MTREDQNEMWFDALLKVSLSDALKNEMDLLPSNKDMNEKYKLSAEVDKRIKKIIIRHRNSSKIMSYSKNLHKIVACFIIVVVLSSITLISVEATRNTIFNILIEQFGKYTEIQFQDSDTDMEQNEIYRPTYITEGFKEKSTQTYGNTIIIKYTDDLGTEILFKQRLADAGIALIDNENTKYIEIEIAGNKAYLFEALTKDEYSVLLWQYQGVVFELTSSIGSDELIQVGNSVKIK